MRVIVGVLLVALLITGFPAPSGARQQEDKEDSSGDARLAYRHRRFLEEVTLLMGEREREVFLDLAEDYQRDRFVDRFWRVRDPYPQTSRNEFRDRWESNAEAARLRFDDLSDPRAQMVLFFGEENRRIRSTCTEILQPLDVWYFGSIQGVRPEFYIVFLRTGRGARLWSPRQGLLSLRGPRVRALTDPELLEQIAESCSRGDEIVTALLRSADWEAVRDALPLRPRLAEEWVASFLSASTDVPEDAEWLPAGHSTRFPGIRQSRSVVQLLLTVPRGEAATGVTGSYRHHDFLVDGEILRQDELFETFRYKFTIPAEGPHTEDSASEAIPLAVERYLRPGTYTWIVKLRDLNGDRYFRLREEIDVPNLRLAGRRGGEGAPGAAPPLSAPPRPDGTLELLGEANASLAASATSGDHVVKLWAPRDRLLTGIVRVEARTRGEDIDRVAFDLNGKEVLSKSHAPYSVEMNLGRAPRLHSVAARALDAGGRTLARDELMLNSGPHSFRLRLVEPQRGHRYTKSVRAHAEVELPEGEVLDRVEVYLNETLLATLYQPPFIQPIVIPPGQELGYVRAVAYLDDGNSTEDLVFVNSPHPIDEIQVDFVELYASVFDSKGRPVEGLAESDFVVREDGEQQTIRRFELVSERPIHAGILLDNSTSMEDSLEEAEEAALRFFDSVLRPKDRACLISFNDVPQLLVPFTNDLEILAGGLAGLVAEGETALHDSLIFALHYFSGLKGKRALILLSDGQDVRSKYDFDEVLEFARRTGVAIYSIGLDVSHRDIMPRSKLIRLAAETGGRHFFIDEAEGLSSVYRKIETELRAQYLIAYQSSRGSTGDDAFREVDLEVSQRGLEAKTMRGYYP